MDPVSEKDPVVTIDIDRISESTALNQEDQLLTYYNSEHSFYRTCLPDYCLRLDAWIANPSEAIAYLNTDNFKHIELELSGELERVFANKCPSQEGYNRCISLIPGDILAELGITTDSLEFLICVEQYYLQWDLETETTTETEIITNYLPIDGSGINPEHPSHLNPAVSSLSQRRRYTSKPSPIPEPVGSCPSYPPSFPKPVFEPCQYPHLLKLYGHFYTHCYNQRNLHALAGAYYNNMNKKFVAPTLIISALSSIASFVASSEVVPDNWKVILTLSVGVSTSLNALVQSFASAYQFDAKANSHFGAADNYDRLITEIDFEKSYPNNPDFFQKLEKKILDVKSNCQYLVPSYIKSEYYNKQNKVESYNFVRDKIISPVKNEITEQVLLGNLDQSKLNKSITMVKFYVDELRKLEELVVSPQTNKNCQCGQQNDCCSQKDSGNRQRCCLLQYCTGNKRTDTFTEDITN
jgi:hypothetical protein